MDCFSLFLFAIFHVKILFSHGGWSAPSAATAYVCPGQKDNPVDFTTRWSRIAIGGPLSIIDRLKAHPHVREDYIRGLQLLIVFGQREDGFHKGAVAIGVATTAIQGLKIYLEDPLIIPAALLVLGYASRSAQYAVVEQMVVEGNVVAFCRQYHTLFRHDTKVIIAISFLQSCLSIVTLIPDGEADDGEVEFLENNEFGELLV